MTVRMRHTRSHTNNRRSHHALATPSVRTEGSSVRLSHRMDPKTGIYRGRKVLDLGAKITKKATKKSTKTT